MRTKNKSGWAERLRIRARDLKNMLPALALALRDPQTPWFARLMTGLTVGYALSPVDLIPDFIPVLGWLDDLLILPGLATLTVRLIPPEVLARCRAEAGKLWADDWPKKWCCAIPVVLFWALLLFLLVRAIFF